MKTKKYHWIEKNTHGSTLTLAVEGPSMPKEKEINLFNSFFDNHPLSINGLNPGALEVFRSSSILHVSEGETYTYALQLFFPDLPGTLPEWIKEDEDVKALEIFTEIRDRIDGVG